MPPLLPSVTRHPVALNVLSQGRDSTLPGTASRSWEHTACMSRLCPGMTDVSDEVAVSREHVKARGTMGV
eukprot:10467-Heterococcus_DN1.PRE.8